MSGKHPLALFSFPRRARPKERLPLLLQPVAATFRDPSLVDCGAGAELPFNAAPALFDEYPSEVRWGRFERVRIGSLPVVCLGAVHPGKLPRCGMGLYGRLAPHPRPHARPYRNR